MKESASPRANGIPDDATCVRCGYRLVHLPRQTCPECGSWFDPNDHSTFLRASSKAGWRRWARPPAVTECSVFIGLSGYGLVNASGPAQWEAASICMVGLVGVPLWLGFVAAYLVRLVACWRDRGGTVRDRGGQRHRRRWAVVPVCILLIYSSFAYPWPMMLRFRLSQSAFKAALKDHQSGTFTPRRWVGLYHVKKVNDIIYLNNRPPSIGFITGHSIADPVGFAYDPLPSHPMGYKAVEVAPSWYSYED